MYVHFLNQDHFAGFLSLCICFVLGFSYSLHNNYKFLFHCLNFIGVFLIYHLVETYIRGAWLSVLVVIVFLYTAMFQKNKANKGRRINIFFSCLFFSISVLLIYGLYLLKPDSANGRLLIWKVTLLYIIGDNLLKGIGFGNFSYKYNKAQAQYFLDGNGNQSEMLLAGNVEHAHNEYLHFAAEIGLPLALLMLFLLVWIFKTPQKSNFNSSVKNCWLNGLLVGSKCAMLSVSITAFFSFPLHIWQTATAFSCCVLSVFLLQSKYMILSTLITNHGFLPKERITKLGRSLASFVIILYVTVIVFVYEHLSYVDYQQEQMELAQAYAMSGRTDIAISIYESLAPKNTNNGKFLFLFGAAHLKAENYGEAKNLLERSEKIYSNPNLYLSLAKTYTELGLLQLAEDTYWYAFYMIPHRFYPLHELTALYMQQNKKEEALTVAKQIVSMPVKISSPAVTEIKKSAVSLITNLR